MQKVVDKKMINVFQDKLKQKLIEKSDLKMEEKVGFQGGDIEGTFYYYKDLDIWYFYEEIIDKPVNRYRNAFGLGKPGYSEGIIVQINIPFNGKNKLVAGKFMRDYDGEIWLCHDGKIGGSKKGVGKKTFMDQTNTQNGYYRVTNLSSKDIIKEIEEFVNKVKDIKESVD